MTSDTASLEGRVFRMMKMDDGLLDVYLGIMLIPYAIWIYNPDASVGPIISPFLAFALAYPLFVVLKKRVVTPRVGSVKPGPSRRRKTNILLLASIAGVALTAALVLATAFAPDSALTFMAGVPRVFWIFSACVIGATIVTAWIASTPRLAIYGLLAAISIPLDAVFIMRTGQAPSTLVPILVMIGTGLFLFVRFLNKYPARSEAELG